MRKINVKMLYVKDVCFIYYVTIICRTNALHAPNSRQKNTIIQFCEISHNRMKFTVSFRVLLSLGNTISRENESNPLKNTVNEIKIFYTYQCMHLYSYSLYTFVCKL